MFRKLLSCLLLGALPVLAGESSFAWRPLDRSEGMPSDDVFDLCSGGPGRVWAATAAGLCRIERHEIRLFGPPGTPRLLAPAPGDGVYALFPKGIAWVREGGAEWIDPPIDPARAAVDAMRSESDGTLWVLSRGEVYRRRTGGAFERVPDRTDLGSLAPAPPDCSGAPSPVHAAILHRNEIWGATRGHGILRKRRTPRFQRVPLPNSDRVHALAAAPDGTLWCGTANGVARVKDGAAEAIVSIDGSPLGVVTGCAVDREGRVWIGSGSSFPGVYRLDGSGWHHLDDIHAYVHRITTDTTGVLWFAVLNRTGASADEGEGAWYYSEGQFHRAPAIEGFPSARVYDVVARDPSGVLWFATLKGLAAYEGGDRITHYTPESGGLPGEKVWCLAAARDGSLWIGYQAEHGVSRLSRGQITHYDVEDGLCDGNVWAIAEGKPGVMWFATQSGLSRFDGRRWSCFRGEEGLGLAPIWPLLPMPDGSLWIGTIGEGVVHLVPDDREAPRTQLAQTRVESEAGDEVVIPWTGHDAWFDTPAADLWYRWRLDEGAWSKASPVRSLSLRPAPGRHRVDLQAIDRFGNAEDPPREVEIEVLGGGAPWGYYGAGAALLLLLGFVIGRRDRRGRS